MLDVLNKKAFAAADNAGIIHAWGTESSGGSDSSIDQQDGTKDVVILFYRLSSWCIERKWREAWGNTSGGGDSSGVEADLTNIKHVYSNGFLYSQL